MHAPNFEKGDVEFEFVRRGLGIAHLQHRLIIAAIEDDGQSTELRDKLPQYFQSLSGEVGGLQRQSGHVTARIGQTGDKAAAHRVDRHRKYDGDDAGRLPYRGNGASNGNNDIHLLADKLRRDFRVTLGAPFRPSILDRNSKVIYRRDARS